MSEKHTSGQFRESFKGYNKEDVNVYIQQMFHQFEERERAILRQYKEMPQKNTVVASAVSAEQIEELNSKIAARDSEIAALRARIAEMEEGAIRYEKMSAQLGDIMLRARSDADRIKELAEEEACRIEANAKIKADEVTAKADQYALQIREEALKQADTIITYASDRMKHLYHEGTEGYAGILETLRHQTEHFSEKLNEYRDHFPAEMDDAKDIAKEAVKQFAKNQAESFCIE